MTLAYFTKRPYTEYVAVSIEVLDVPKHADVDANNMEQIRMGLARDWTGAKDLIQIRKSMTNILGYVGLDHTRGLYYWIGRNGECRLFNPSTGKLGGSIPIPQKSKGLIYEEETWEIEQGYRKKRTVTRRL